jgi:tripartite-type tricarboxylate transporter receptor subunit TctC
VALGIAAKEKPDGYHLEVCASGLFTIVPHVRPVSYKLEEFVPIMNYSTAQSAFSVKADAPWQTLKDVVEYAKKNPGKFTYFGGAVGSTTHLAIEFVAKAEGAQFTMVPFQGGAPALAALLGGHIHGHSGNTFRQAREGSARILAVQTEKRLKSFPNIPTFKELGYDFYNDDMFLVVAPRGTPAAIVKKLDEAFKKAMEDPLFIEAITKMELLITYRGPEDLKKYLGEAAIRYGKMVEEFKIPKEEEKK